MAPLVRTGGSRHTGLAALPHRNIHELKNVKIKQETMEYLITLAFKTGGKSYRNTLLIVLYDKNKDMFLKCFKKNSQI